MNIESIIIKSLSLMWSINYIQILCRKNEIFLTYEIYDYII